MTKAEWWSAGGSRKMSGGKMPARYWVYAFCGLIGVSVSGAVVRLAAAHVRWLLALSALPAFAGAPLPHGAVYRGRLEGTAETTPLGQSAVVWIGVVTQTVGRGRGRYTTEACRLGRVTDLRLDVDGERFAIGAPALGQIELKLALVGRPSPRTRYWLGETRSVTPIPDDIIARCHLDAQRLGQGEWTYAEQAAPPGTVAELAGCAIDHRLGSCDRAGGAVALGHLSTAGLHAMVRRMADVTMRLTALMIFVMTLFTLIGGAGVVLVLRGAAAAPPPGQRR